MYPNAEGVTLLDTCILSYLARVLDPSYLPAGQPVDDQGIATLRLHFWGVALGVGRVPIREVGRTPHELDRWGIDRMITNLLDEPELPPAAGPRLKERAHDLMRVHPHEEDCLVVAEAEILHADCLITFDKKMRKKLNGVASIAVLSPTELWVRLVVPHGTPPKIVPHPTNPLRQQTFWRW